MSDGRKGNECSGICSYNYNSRGGRDGGEEKKGRQEKGVCLAEGKSRIAQFKLELRNGT